MPINTLGFGVFSLAFYRDLILSGHFNVNIEPIGNNKITDDVENLLTNISLDKNRLLHDLDKSYDKDNVTITIWHPQQMEIALKSNKLNIGYVHFETDYLNSQTVNKLNKHNDLTLTCSHWGQSILDELGVNSKVLHGPNPLRLYSRDTFEYLYPPFDLPKAALNKHIIMSSGKWEKRKGHHIIVDAMDHLENTTLLAVWDNPFTGGDTQPMQYLAQKGWRLLFRFLYNGLINCFEKNGNMIVLFSRRTKYEDIIRMYATVELYISASAGEGWDLPLVEASTITKIIGTANTAHLEYLSKSEYIPVKGSVVANDSIFFNGTQGSWYPTDVTKLVFKIKDFFREKEEYMATVDMAGSFESCIIRPRFCNYSVDLCKIIDAELASKRKR